MKLSALYLDDNVAVPGWTRVAGGVNTGRDASFNAAEGWDIERIEPGVYQLMREGMPEPVRVEGYGASYVVLPIEHALADAVRDVERQGAAIVTSIDGDGPNVVTLGTEHPQDDGPRTFVKAKRGKR